MNDAPREQRRRGCLKHGNPSGDFLTAPRCGARTRRGTPCQGPAMHGRKRCRLNGGKSTGPRTAEGLERAKRAAWRHGFYSEAAREERRQARRAVLESRRLIERLSRLLD